MRERMWEIRQQARDGVLDVYIYGDVEGDYYNLWRDEVVRSETSANALREALAAAGDVNQINVYINSYGGSVFEGTAIYNQLKRHPAHKTVYVDGFACSIASVIAMAGDTVVMPRNSLMMIHNMWMGICGNAAELRKAADDLDVINAAGRQAYLSKAGEKLPEGELVAMMDAESWLTAEDCVRLGLADEYAEKDADMSAAAAVLQKANLDISQRIEVHKSLAAQLRQITVPEERPKAETEEKTDEKPGMSIAQMLAGFFDAQN